jgi:hypothetical protein
MEAERRHFSFYPAKKNTYAKIFRQQGELQCLTPLKKSGKPVWMKMRLNAGCARM